MMRKVSCGESAILLYGRKDSGMESLLPVVEIRSCMFFRHQNNNLRLLGIAGSIKEAYEIVLKLVQTGYNNDCIYEMKEYLEKF